MDKTIVTVLTRKCFPLQMKNFSSQKSNIRLGNSDLLIHSHLNRTFHIQDIVESHALTENKQTNKTHTKTKPRYQISQP